jgi:hypothetical protein
MRETADDRGPVDEDVFALEFSDEVLEATAGGGNGAFPTFTCSVPMCATGGGCGTWPGLGRDL